MSKRRVDSRWVSTVLRVIVGGVFVFSGWTKIVDINETIRSVRNYQLLPEAIVPSVGTALPLLELVLAALLITGLITRITAGFTFVLSLAFFIGVASAWARGLQIECGCFGNGGLTNNPVPGYLRELVLNGGIMIACTWLLRKGAGALSLDGFLGLTSDDLEHDDYAEPESSIGVKQ